MKNCYKQWICLLTVLILSSALCLALNRWDNKYTKSGVQGIDGLLVLSEEELQENKIHYLISGWAFYPGVLLTPDDLNENADSFYMYYTSIGQDTHFDTDDSNPHGCGTYVLTLVLPEEGDYALDLPEIYSAYKLYLNDELVLQVGDPEEETYTAQTQSRTVTFKSGGTVTILLAVSDYSHFYSGLVYPPAFGTLLSLNLVQIAQFGVTFFLLAAALIAAALSCYMGIRMHRGNSLLFSLLCLLSAFYTASPLLHSVASLSVHPWYALELFGWYGMTFLVIVLQNRLCQAAKLPSRISEAAAGLFSIAALCYGLFSSFLTTPVMNVFSAASSIYKLASAAYLLFISMRTLRIRNTSQDYPAASTCTTPGTERPPLVSSILFYGTVFYAVMLLWDRILPDFEPVVSGWFPEWGCAALIIAIGASIWHDLVSTYAYSLVFQEEYRQMQRQLEMQMEYSEQLKQRSEETRRIAHDFRQHLRTVTELALQIQSTPDTENAQKALMKYLEKYPDDLAVRTGSPIVTYCNHPAVDALLQYYNSAAVKQHTNVQFSIYIPDGIQLIDIEWCSVLGNLLENALEACARQGGEEQKAAILTHITGNMFYVKVENTYDGKYRRQDGHFLSRKTERIRPGVGLESVTEIVTNHGGSVHIYPDEKIFTVGITLPIKKADESIP